jgi:hypothetical protein
MTTQVRNILESFDLLPEMDKRELAAEILRRSQVFDTPSLTDVSAALRTVPTALASEAVLAKDWLRPEEDEAWRDL